MNWCAQYRYVCIVGSCRVLDVKGGVIFTFEASMEHLMITNILLKSKLYSPLKSYHNIKFLISTGFHLESGEHSTSENAEMYGAKFS